VKEPIRHRPASLGLQLFELLAHTDVGVQGQARRRLLPWLARGTFWGEEGFVSHNGQCINLLWGYRVFENRGHAVGLTV
jgi:hypothetical protein